MATRATGSELAGPLRVVWDGGIPAGVGDGPLLARFAAGGEGGGDDEGAEIAFEALIGRHGPMVLRVCHSLLGDRHAAEDAFQAVFLVLARRAGSIREPERLAPWLHGVALRVAREARSRERRRLALDRAIALATRPGPDEGSDWPGLPIARREASEALHAAIDRLPGRYREAVVLCDLEGLAVVEAASRLGCPPSTLGVRLMRARRRLRDRLDGREPGLLAVPPLVPTGLIGATARLAARFASGQGVAGSALAVGVLRALRMARLKAAGAVVALAAGLVAAGGWAATHRPAMADPGQPPRPVVAEAPPQQPRPPEPALPPGVARPTAGEVRENVVYVGHADASRTIEVRARVGGTIEKAEAREGMKVKAGDVLFEIDARPYEIQREIADAQLLKARARLERAEVELANTRSLIDRKGISQREIGLYLSNEKEARAGVAIAEAELKRAVLDLESTRVRAAFNGEVGSRFVEAGVTVKGGEILLATLIETDPIAVNFDVSEKSFLQIRRLILAGKMDAEIPVAVASVDEGKYTRNGKIRIEGGRVDPANGTIRLRAEFPNADRALIPGLFLQVRVAVGPPHPALLVPESAILNDEGRTSVQVLGGRDVVEVRPVVVNHSAVVVGNLDGDLREVREGLAAGDRFLLKPQKDIRPLSVLPGEPTPPAKP